MRSGEAFDTWQINRSPVDWAGARFYALFPQNDRVRNHQRFFLTYKIKGQPSQMGDRPDADGGVRMVETVGGPNKGTHGIA